MKLLILISPETEESLHLAMAWHLFSIIVGDLLSFHEYPPDAD